MEQKSPFNKVGVLEHLGHYLPTQAPLKDFIHHNTLHAFQSKKFHDAVQEAAQTFGYKVYLRLEEYAALHAQGQINDTILDQILSQSKIRRDDLFGDHTEPLIDQKIGRIRSYWKNSYHLDMDTLVHPVLFRVIGAYLDQGVAIWNFPVYQDGFLDSLRTIERTSAVSFFRTKRAQSLLLDSTVHMEDLLQVIVGKEEYFEDYLFDQQFAHPGWSGMINVLGESPNSLLDNRKINLEELICFELLLEIDALDDHFGQVWAPISQMLSSDFLLHKDSIGKRLIYHQIWQDAYEWSYYDRVLKALATDHPQQQDIVEGSFQALFCIDDREGSLRRHIEIIDPNCQTYGTAGFFNVEFYFQPMEGKFRTKVCPAPMQPKYLIKELEGEKRIKKDFHFGKRSHNLFMGWIYTHTLGFWSAFKLLISVFRPVEIAAAVRSEDHMHPESKLSVKHRDGDFSEDGLQIGFTHFEMAKRVEGLLRSIGLINHFAPFVYLVGHGSSSVNNTHYAGYDCGACSGRPGSVNARVMAHMANDPTVRKMLVEVGIVIPSSTRFLGALHDTSRDEIQFYDQNELSIDQQELHQANVLVFQRALQANARERSRRFLLIDSSKEPDLVHKKVKQRTISLFEPRPELNHATNALCIVGQRSFSKNIFLDRRSFLNSYCYKNDSDGKLLSGILNAVAPVCGGINLEYYFSRVDNQQLGAGTKLPHNVMGLIGVANGIEGDLRTGLPKQMIEVHDPLRLLVIVEQAPELVLLAIQTNSATYEWFANEWVHLVCFDPLKRSFFRFQHEEFVPYVPVTSDSSLMFLQADSIFNESGNIPVQLLNTKSHGTAC